MEWETVGTVGVDTATLLITDPAYLDHWGHDDAPGAYSLDGLRAGILGHSATSLRFPRGHDGAGVAVLTGYGDGIYPVQIARTEDGHVAAVRVLFIGEDGDRVSGAQ